MSASDIGNGSLAAQHMAMPRLMGAPAYARPKRHVESIERPFDPDDLPLEAHRTEEDRNLAEAIAEGRAVTATDVTPAVLRPSDASGLRAIAARLIKPRG